MASAVNWGIIGTGNIARTFAKGVAGSRTGKLAAVGSRSQASADKFGDEFKVPHRHPSYDALLANKDVQAVYISTPHPLHAEWAIKAADAGKHILCEKPIGINFAEAMAIVEAAQRNDVFLMEAFMYRCHPQTHKLVQLLREKAIGDVRIVNATFSFHWPIPFDPKSRLVSNALAGGGILDVGCYCTSMARLVAGVAAGKDFAEPLDVKAVAHLGSTGVDEWSVGVLRFPGDILAQVSTGVQLNQESSVRIYGTTGNIYLPSPWLPSENVKMVVTRNGQTEEITIAADRSLYALEADTVAEHLERRQAAPPAMTWEDTLGNMRTLDRWRESIGLTYESEKVENLKRPAAGKPLRVRPRNNMKYGRIEGLDKPVSRLAVGTDITGAIMREAMFIFDDYFERGGNVFDTAHIYGVSDIRLGHWIRTRGVRDKVVVLGKGAHTPNCNPEALTAQLTESLERMGTDHIDIYMMHRDNPQVPVGEFIDVLNEHKKAGRMRAFGGSNWSIERVQAANDYAKSKGLAGFCAVSNNFSLARMVDPVWAGCIQASDPASRAWFTKTQLPLMPWSSQARGFFTERAAPEKKDDAELVRCWYAQDNFRRKQRVNEMAAKRGVLPITLALAYVLNQPFPTFPLIGPRQISETRTSFPALDIELSPAELRWLNLED